MAERSYGEERILLAALAREAGGIALNHQCDPGIRLKPDGSVVTDIDELINQYFIEAIEDVETGFSDISVLGEEASSRDTTRPHKLYLDPIDDTAGYVLGQATSNVSAGLVAQNTAVLGVTFNPFVSRSQLVVGETGKGTYDGEGKQLVVSKRTPDAARIAISASIHRMRTEPTVDRLLAAGFKLNALMGAVHKGLMVARGNVEGWVSTQVQPHDVAAIDVIVTEAGGRVTDLQGYPLDYEDGVTEIVASNGRVHDAILQALAA